MLFKMLVSNMPSLLHAFWLLAGGSVVVVLMNVPLPAAFKDAVRLSAARGKLWGTRPKPLGWLNECCVPQGWFLHFYAIGTVCCITLLAMQSFAAVVLGLHHVMDHCRYVALVLFSAHLVRRLAETQFVMVYPKTAKMHVIAYIFGLAYYIVAPLSLMGPTFWATSEHSVSTPASLLYWFKMATTGSETCTVYTSTTVNITACVNTTVADSAGNINSTSQSLTASVHQETVNDTLTVEEVAGSIAETAADITATSNLIGNLANLAGAVAGGQLQTAAQVVQGVASGVSTVLSTAGEIASTVSEVIDALDGGDNDDDDAKQRSVLLDQARSLDPHSTTSQNEGHSDGSKAFPHELKATYNAEKHKHHGNASAASPSGSTRSMMMLRGIQSVPSLCQQSIQFLIAHGQWLNLLGACVMLVGFMVQCHTHVILARLARQAQRQKAKHQDEKQVASSTSTTCSDRHMASHQHTQQHEEEVYLVPHGGLFPWVSCPHYLGEVLIYLGLALLSSTSLTGLMFAWVVVNLVLAAVATQTWYHQHIPNYPRSRRALVPFIF